MVPCAVSSILTNHPNKIFLKKSAQGFGKLKNCSYIYDIRLNALVVELVDTTVLETVASSLASSSLARGTRSFNLKC